jgi:polyhydroxybutyrate depolymerase
MGKESGGMGVAGHNGVIAPFAMGFESCRWILAIGAGMLGVMAGLVLCGCTPGLSRMPGQAAVSYEVKVDVRFHGLRRSYRVHLPPGYDAARPLPMVVVVHGAFDTARGMERFTGFSDLADQEHFIALYPNGIGILGYLQHWNAGHCCGKAAADEIDDVGFLARVIEDACARLAVDPRRIYMTGFSNGGMMVHRFACERGDLLAAVAPLAATAGGRPDNLTPEWSIAEPIRPMPLLAIHGSADDYVPFGGGTSPARDDTREYWPVMRSLDVWIRSNGCGTTPVTRYERQGKVHVTTWQKGAQGADVVLYLLEGWGHQWPGPYFTATLDAGDPLRGFDAARIIWDFFKGHAR